MTIKTETTDPRAAITAAAAVRDQLTGETVDVYHRGLLDSDDASGLAEKVVAGFAVRYERDAERGLRRVVLAGEWEVDPAGVAMRRPVAQVTT